MSEFTIELGYSWCPATVSPASPVFHLLGFKPPGCTDKSYTNTSCRNESLSMNSASVPDSLEEPGNLKAHI